MRFNFSAARSRNDITLRGMTQCTTSNSCPLMSASIRNGVSVSWTYFFIPMFDNPNNVWIQEQPMWRRVLTFSTTSVMRDAAAIPLIWGGMLSDTMRMRIDCPLCISPLHSSKYSTYRLLTMSLWSSDICLFVQNWTIFVIFGLFVRKFFEIDNEQWAQKPTRQNRKSYV